MTEADPPYQVPLADHILGPSLQGEDHLVAHTGSTPVQAIKCKKLEAGYPLSSEYKLLHQTIQCGVPEQRKNQNHLLLLRYRQRHLNSWSYSANQ